MNTKLNIGLFGFGCVGKGLYHVLLNSNLKVNICKIAIKNQNKIRDVPSQLFTHNKFDILHNTKITLVVELINDADEAFEIVKYALQNGKHVVSANKKMIATHLKELVQLQQQYNVKLLYEASVCGSIPIVKTLEEYFGYDKLNLISGVFNGTTNYILSRITDEKISYKNALHKAQNLGFAESDPSSDIEGFDSKYKAVIIALHAFGVYVKPNSVLNIGISTLAQTDIDYANKHNCTLKLIATIKRIKNNKIVIFVLPKFVAKNTALSLTSNEYNAVQINSEFCGEQFFQGKGAGAYPTGFAVLSDISSLLMNYEYSYKKLQGQQNSYTNSILIKAYFRFNSLDNLKHIIPIEVYEECYFENQKSIIGLFSVENLIKKRYYFIKENLFIATLGDEVFEHENAFEYESEKNIFSN
ncbi:MAG: homoserine dehydrogenase [Bacteroidetes bacterium]|nr:homoserine dehydrogenase [Bacteroidota bacterium]